MKAWWIRTGPEGMALELRETAQPQPGPGQVAVRIRAASLNRGEILAAQGSRQPGEKPAGGEAAGEVVAVGAGVTGLQTGDRVMGRCDGGFAEYGLMLAEEAFPVPAGFSWQQAGCGSLVYSTVHDMLIGQGRLQAGEWLLVTGVTSGVGVAALQVGKALGAKVIGTSGSAQKLERLKPLGLDVALATRGPDLLPQVQQATGGRGVDLVVNNVGGSVFAACIEALGFEGRLVTVGYLDGVLQAQIDLGAVHRKRLQVFGVSNKLRQLPHRVAAAQAFRRELLPLMESGQVAPLVDQVFPFEQLPQAVRAMDEGRAVGKLVLEVSA